MTASQATLDGVACPRLLGETNANDTMRSMAIRHDVAHQAMVVNGRVRLPDAALEALSHSEWVTVTVRDGHVLLEASTLDAETVAATVAVELDTDDN